MKSRCGSSRHRQIGTGSFVDVPPCACAYAWPAGGVRSRRVHARAPPPRRAVSRVCCGVTNTTRVHRRWRARAAPATRAGKCMWLHSQPARATNKARKPAGFALRAPHHAFVPLLRSVCTSAAAHLDSKPENGRRSCARHRIVTRSSVGAHTCQCACGQPASARTSCGARATAPPRSPVAPLKYLARRRSPPEATGCASLNACRAHSLSQLPASHQNCSSGARRLGSGRASFIDPADGTPAALPRRPTQVPRSPPLAA